LYKRTSCMCLVYVTMWDGHGGLQAASKRSWNSFLGCWLKLVVCETRSVWRLTRAALSLWGWQGLRRGSINPSRIPRLNYSDLFFYHRHRLYFRMARTIIGGRLLYKGGLECGHRWLHTSCPLLDTTKHGWLNPFLETVLEWIYLWAARVGCVRVGLSGAVLTDPYLFGALIIFRVPFQHSRIHRLCVSAMFCLISSSMGFNMAQSNERMILGVYRNDSSVVIAGHMHHANFVIGMHRQLDG